MDNRKIEALPLNGRNYPQLVGLQAGVINAPASALGGRGGIEFHGSPALGNNLLLDGVDMSFGESNATAGDIGAGSGGRGSLIQTVSVEAIQEFKATGSAFSAEYGRATGGVLNVTTKSGTNQFTGTLFEFFRRRSTRRKQLLFQPLRPVQTTAVAGTSMAATWGDRSRKTASSSSSTMKARRSGGPRRSSGTVPTPLLRQQLTPGLRGSMEGLPEDFTPTTDPLDRAASSQRCPQER